jgi:hypothetical protein
MKTIFSYFLSWLQQILSCPLQPVCKWQADILDTGLYASNKALLAMSCTLLLLLVICIQMSALTAVNISKCTAVLCATTRRHNKDPGWSNILDSQNSGLPRNILWKPWYTDHLICSHQPGRKKRQLRDWTCQAHS